MEAKTINNQKGSFCPTQCFALILALVISLHPTLLQAGQPDENQINQLRFKEQMWDAQVLRIFIEGPKHLSSDLEFKLPEPPENNSPQSHKELETLLKYQSDERSKTTIEKIKSEAQTGDFVKIFLTDKTISQSLANASYNVLTMANDECQFFVVKYKKRFARPRPDALMAALYPANDPDKKLQLVVPNPGHAAYPSGHATQSMLMALILGQIDPTHKTNFETYARDVAKRREIAGVHYPSDSATGQQLANALFNKLMKLPVFKVKLQEAKIRFQKAE